jgi:hypothetical protein
MTVNLTWSRAKTASIAVTMPISQMPETRKTVKLPPRQQQQWQRLQQRQRQWQWQWQLRLLSRKRTRKHAFCIALSFFFLLLLFQRGGDSTLMKEVPTRIRRMQVYIYILPPSLRMRTKISYIQLFAQNACFLLRVPFLPIKIIWFSNAPIELLQEPCCQSVANSQVVRLPPVE